MHAIQQVTHMLCGPLAQDGLQGDGGGDTLAALMPSLISPSSKLIESIMDLIMQFQGGHHSSCPNCTDLKGLTFSQQTQNLSHLEKHLTAP